MPFPGITPDSSATYEDAVFAEKNVASVAERILAGETFKEIGEDLGLDRRQIAKLAGVVRERITEETRADLAVWQAQKFHEMNDVLRRLKPFVAWDYARESAGDPQERPDAKLVAQYANMLKTVVIVMTADRHAGDINKVVDDLADAAVHKAQLVQEYMALADKVIAGINDHGYGSGTAPEEEVADEDELDPAYARADNSHTIDDAVVLDGSDGWVESDLDSLEGEWVDGKFTPTPKKEQ